MEVYGYSSEENKQELITLGIAPVDVSNFESIRGEDTVIINDKDNFCSTGDINKLLDKGTNLIYLYTTPKQENIRQLIKRSSYNIYKIEDLLEIDTLISVLESQLSLSDVEHLIDKDIEVNSLSELVEVTDNFFTAIDNKEKEELEKIYLNHFNDMLKLPEMFKEVLSSSHDKETELHKLNKMIEANTKEITSLEGRLDKLITAGRKTEEINTGLMKAVENLKVVVTNKEEAIKATSEEVFEQSRSIQKLEKEKSDLTIQLSEATENRNYLKMKYDKAVRELDELTVTVKGVNMSIENVEVNLTSTGTIEKILYIKAVDMVPDIVTSMELYPRYVEGKLKIDGCSVMIIAPKSSTLYSSYANKYNKFNPEESSYDKGIYVMDGYSEKIEHFVGQVESQVLIIIDLTLREGQLTTSVRQHNMYVVDNMESIGFNKLNPSNCIGFGSLHDNGVTAHIPSNKAGKSKGVLVKETRESLYVILDRIWR